MARQSPNLGSEIRTPGFWGKGMADGRRRSMQPCVRGTTRCGRGSVTSSREGFTRRCVKDKSRTLVMHGNRETTASLTPILNGLGISDARVWHCLGASGRSTERCFSEPKRCMLSKGATRGALRGDRYLLSPYKGPNIMPVLNREKNHESKTNAPATCGNPLFH